MWLIRLTGAAALLAAATAAAAQECARERAAMIETIRKHVQQDPASLPQGIAGPVLEAMGAIERHRFIPDGTCAVGYVDRPVPIGHRSTISQPFIVALMTHLAEVAADHTALEIGTGSGYQAAVLARLAKQVCTVELVAPLAVRAMRVLNELGYDTVRVRVGDGYEGWPDCGPFDSIIVTAALGHVPAPLIEQLKVGGRLVMPLGPPDNVQYLTVVEKTGPGETRGRVVMLVRFVPFVRPPN
ncbi:MAG: protein-L-isoaspartate(D-aspartate) O-methyltransferase [Hyphomicrobiales bacterium]|nr:protein-L-isoaspartate(D-aspartate) O-methyltransferase [Hyphomicrobiales bacterium]